MRSNELLSLLKSIEQHLARIADVVCDQPPQPIHIDQAYPRQMAARHLSVSVWTIDHARKNGMLDEARRLGQRDIRITGESMLRFQRSRETTKVRVNQI